MTLWLARFKGINNTNKHSIEDKHKGQKFNISLLTLRKTVRSKIDAAATKQPQVLSDTWYVLFNDKNHFPVPPVGVFSHFLSISTSSVTLLTMFSNDFLLIGLHLSKNDHELRLTKKGKTTIFEHDSLTNANTSMSYWQWQLTNDILAWVTKEITKLGRRSLA